MKRIKTTDLAESLLQTTEGKTHEQTKKVILVFAKLLIKNGQAGNINRIIERFEELYAKKHNILNIKVSTATPISKTEKEKIEHELKARYKADKVVTSDTVDKKNIGGMKLQIGDTVYDYTLARRLKQLQTQFLK